MVTEPEATPVMVVLLLLAVVVSVMVDDVADVSGMSPISDIEVRQMS